MKSGGFSYQQAIKTAVDGLAAGGIDAITYPSGHTDSMDVAVRRAVVTGCNQTCAKLTLAHMQDIGAEFVETSAHGGARPQHAAWQGKQFHVGGAKTVNGKVYADFATATGYGTGAGLCGWNCRHSFYPFFPGASSPAYSADELEKLNARDIEYNGKKYTRYEVDQLQRQCERNIRATKRQYLAESAAETDTTGTAAKLARQRAQLADLCAQTGNKADSSRISAIGFGHSAASKAVWDVRKATPTERSYSFAVGTPKTDLAYIQSEAYKKKFDSISDNKELNRLVYERCRAAVTHQSGDYYEDLSIITANGHRIIGTSSGIIPNETYYSSELLNRMKNYPRGELVSIHNHGTNLPPTGSDLSAAGYR